MATVIFLTAGTTSWTVPANCTSAKVECIGGGAGGRATGSYRAGGGGGEYSVRNSVALTPGASIPVSIAASVAGTAGNDTWFNGTSAATATCSAKGGQTSSGVLNQTGGAGGTGGNGDVTYPGGAGGNATGAVAPGGGGGAGGPNGAGVNGATGTGKGGAGDAGFGGYGANAGFNGGAGAEFDASHGCGGGGGARTNAGVGGQGGLYGGGGGGSAYTIGSLGQAGLIVITYEPSNALNADLAITLPALTFSASGDVFDAAEVDLAITLPQITVAAEVANAGVDGSASLAATLDAVTVAVEALAGGTAALAATLPGVVVQAEALVAATATIAATLQGIEVFISESGGAGSAVNITLQPPRVSVSAAVAAGWRPAFSTDRTAISGAIMTLPAPTTDGYQILYWDAAGMHEDLDVLARLRSPMNGDEIAASVVIGPYSFLSGLRFDVRNDQKLQIMRGFGDILGEAEVSWISDEWFWVRCRVRRRRVFMKIWMASELEPETWAINEPVDDLDIVDRKAGLITFASTSTSYSYSDFDVDYFAVGHDLRSAPLPQYKMVVPSQEIVADVAWTNGSDEEVLLTWDDDAGIPRQIMWNQ